jgi:hypothetical protein
MNHLTEAEQNVFDEIAYLVLNRVSLREIDALGDGVRTNLVAAMKRVGAPAEHLVTAPPVFTGPAERPQGAPLSLFALSRDEIYAIAERAVADPDAMTLNEIRVMAEFIIEWAL